MSKHRYLQLDVFDGRYGNGNPLERVMHFGASAKWPVARRDNACIAERLHSEGRLPGNDSRYVANQGREVGRDGRVHVEVDAEADVWIGGMTRQVIEGRIDW
ncbi:Epimerase, PhzC/PhzF [Xanthomonas fragariae]|uniref:Epimerase, PhzC/PhzF n=1 Tax=Xanthomonas fragariae TaxID=48664 RepID=A0A1Y6H4L6_9XANT|nr:hypothetical protein BER92_13395 [Xanthomonas fragariae]ENZ97166.1 Epimerase, PhzC/PhzF [Xanthomonas fragariae LMG 25863]AOD18936.1 hypothetical protein BER93_13425 [Xanthomonas fragariae]SMQ96099.1 Epimerase, PhzC/PhzF [Xanthomonas fragariae]SMQ98475.1 hypothetical protein PD885_01224 [Xanthomonas fragariae]